MASAAVFVVKPHGTAEVLAACGDTRRGFPYPPLDLADPLVASLIRHPRVVEIAEPAQLHEALLAVTGREVGRVVITPQSAGPDVAAILVLGRRSREPLSKRETEFVAIVSETMGLAIRSRSLAAESQHTAAVLQTAYAVSRAITQSLDLELTYREIAANAARVAPGLALPAVRARARQRRLPGGGLLRPRERGAPGHARPAAGRRGARSTRGPRGAAASSCGGSSPATGPTRARRASSAWAAHLDARLAGLFNAESSVLVPLFAQQELVGSLLVYAVRAPAALLGARGRRAAQRRRAGGHRHPQRPAVPQPGREPGEHRERCSPGSRASATRSARRSRASSTTTSCSRSSAPSTASTTCATRWPSDEAGEFDQAVAVPAAERRRRPPRDLGAAPAGDRRSGPAGGAALAGRQGRPGPGGRSSVSIEEIAGLSDAVTTGLYKIAREALLNALHHARRPADRHHAWSTSTSAGRARPPGCWSKTTASASSPSASAPTSGHYGTVMMEEQATLIGGDDVDRHASPVAAPGSRSSCRSRRVG